MVDVIILSSSVFEREAKKELKDLLDGTVLESLFEGKFVFRTDYDREKVLKILREKDPVFVRNVLPIDLYFEGLGDYGIIGKEIIEKNLLDRGKSFGIESVTYQTEHNSRDLEVRVGSFLEERGFKVDRENMKQLVGIVVYGNRFYIGVVERSDLPYGYLNLAKRFARESMENRRLNRAQFKLIEAFERFSLQPQGEGLYALDIGAAPGGWTKVLAERGYNVIAVDAGELDDSIKRDRKIHHIKKSISDDSVDEIKEEMKGILGENKINIITNDMNLDFENSKRFLDYFYDLLVEGGKVIMTLKGVDRNISRLVDKAKMSLEGDYKIKKIKHLDQNRQELTLYFEKNGSRRSIQDQEV